MNKLSVHQHWDPLRLCIVGKSYGPEFYSWIKNKRARSLFEKIAVETEEDFQNIIRKLESFGVTTFRPRLTDPVLRKGRYLPPPMAPRDHMVMIGTKFYNNYRFDWPHFYQSVRDASWPACKTLTDFTDLPVRIQDECIYQHGLNDYQNHYSCYDHVLDSIRHQGNEVCTSPSGSINGACVTRIGRDLYFAADSQQQHLETYQQLIDHEFTQTRNHIVHMSGHSDAVFCAVCPGLIVSLQEISTYSKTFPDWEVIYLPNQSWHLVKPFMELKKQNQGRWWIPGFDGDQNVIDVVETWLADWVGYVEETVFDVNMLVIDPKNVMVFSYNKQVFDALDRYGITAHVVPFRHRYFWDSGLHCVTTDLHRDGVQQDFFPDRPDITHISC